MTYNYLSFFLPTKKKQNNFHNGQLNFRLIPFFSNVKYYEIPGKFNANAMVCNYRKFFICILHVFIIFYFYSIDPPRAFGCNKLGWGLKVG